MTLPIRTLAVAAALLVTGCTVGPDYHGAPEVAGEALRTGGTFAHAGEGVEAHAPGVARWWTTLGDAQLTALIDDAIARSPDIRAAQAKVRQSRASLRSHQADLLPKAGVDLTMVRTRSPDLSLLGGQSGGSGGSGGRGPLDLYLAGFDASWEIDLFGATRRAVEAASADADAASEDLADAHVQLAAEVAQTYVALRDQQARLALVRDSAQLEGEMLDLTRQRRAGGVASELDVERLVTQVEQTQSRVLPLEADVIESLDQLALLTGRAPGALDAALKVPKALPSVPAKVAIGDPSALLRARPDIRAAERRLASQNAQIGVQTANWFPKLSLMGELGYSALDPGHLVRKDNFSWMAMPRLQWNVLDFGRTQAGVDGAKAGRDQAQAKYESTVLGALRDADVALARYGHQRENVFRLRSVEASATRAATLTRQRYRAGTASTLDWLDAERTRFSAEQDRIAGDAQLLKSFVTLQKALGLGWQVGPETTHATDTSRVPVSAAPSPVSSRGPAGA
ncbi:Outer membrane protein OprM [Pandoraea morbifera]|uniref:Outer membrane protein OprM n=1 Tax=Pandoraea morbifera TaxID=2508300 RepID=A0A5E4UTH7_9BURK|nr:efflux transporter outer membrane subunit [Pandoraea morbifera]VVE02784.1 Outer membrane protein OprM [Pandoraea morbifera]